MLISSLQRLYQIHLAREICIKKQISHMQIEICRMTMNSYLKSLSQEIVPVENQRYFRDFVTILLIILLRLLLGLNLYQRL